MASSFKILKDRVDEELSEIDLPGSPKGLYDPIRYSLGAGGKRTRSVLVLLAFRLFKENIDSALFAALAIEVFHNFTLVHDDLMDGAPIRRNNPTVHSKWSANHAILSGDALLVKSYSLLTQCDPDYLPGILDAFNLASIAVCEGQQLDLDFESSNEVSVPDYLKMIELKTAALVKLCMEIGGLLGGATPKDIIELSGLGNNLGMAFQLQDDILDVYGATEKFGKKRGGDIIAGKKTCLYLMAQQLANDDLKLQLNAAFLSDDMDDDNKVELVTRVYNELDVVGLVEEKMQHYFHEALACLDRVSVKSEKKNDLLLFVNQLMERER